MSEPRPANLLGALVTALNDDLEQATAEAAEHGAAFPAALVSVRWAPGLTIEALRRVLRLSHSGTVRLLDRLERDGSVERRAGRDGRSVALQLTPQGKQQARRIQERRQAVMANALGLLSRAEQQQLLNLVEKLLSGLTRDLEHSNHICRLCDEAACPDASCPVGCAAREAGS